MIMVDFRFTTQGLGFYSLEPASRRAVHRAEGRAPVHYDDTRFALEAAEGLLREGFTVTLDGRELCLASA
jgi:hypothetical protein